MIVFYKLLIAPRWNWNKIAGGYSAPVPAVNRTKVELKSGSPLTSSTEKALLIAPRWNWNWWKGKPWFIPMPVNRTKVELKYGLSVAYECVAFLLIAPRWNWNTVPTNEMGRRLRLLIAPRWNWNCRAWRPARTCRAVNRTKVELKFTVQWSTDRE